MTTSRSGIAYTSDTTTAQPTCTYCGTPYTKTANYQLYCSPKCRNRVRYERISARSERPRVMRACPQCHQDFAANGRQVYCTETCRLAAKRARAVAIMRDDNDGSTPTKYSKDHWMPKAFDAELARITAKLGAQTDLYQVVEHPTWGKIVVQKDWQPDIARFRTTHRPAEADDADPGYCDQCGVWYRWPVRLPGRRLCNVCAANERVAV